MTEKLQMVGYVEAELLEDTVLGKAGTKLRGHEFHFSQDEAEGESPFRFKKLRTGECYEAGESRKNVLGSYLHLHFAGCPEAAATSWRPAAHGQDDPRHGRRAQRQVRLRREAGQRVRWRGGLHRDGRSLGRGDGAPHRPTPQPQAF